MDFKKWVQLAGSERKPMIGATEAGSPDPNEVMQVTVVLREPADHKHPAVADLVSRGERITRDEFASRYGADPADVRKVEAFACRLWSGCGANQPGGAHHDADRHLRIIR